MGSAALEHWTRERVPRIHQIAKARSMVGGSSPGSRIRTDAINGAVVVTLCAEMQGYFRDLHDESSDFLSMRIARGNQAYLTLTRNHFTGSRDLDRGNARPETIQKDFGRLGIETLWDDLENRVTPGKEWRLRLIKLNQARNAIAHNNPSTLQTLAKEGYPLNFQTIKKWRTACFGVIRNADSVVGDKLTQMTQVQPW